MKVPMQYVPVSMTLDKTIKQTNINITLKSNHKVFLTGNSLMQRDRMQEKPHHLPLGVENIFQAGKKKVSLAIMPLQHLPTTKCCKNYSKKMAKLFSILKNLHF